MYDLASFSLKDMTECSAALRSAGAGASTMRQAAEQVIAYLFDNFRAGEGDKPAFALIRLFKTYDYANLTNELQAFADGLIDDPPGADDMKCLTLLASAGVNPEWNTIENSNGHKALPLPSEHFVEAFPMVRQLIQQFGLEVNTVLRPDPAVVLDMAQTTYNVFHIPDAVGSPYVPVQDDFVVPYGVQSVVGFGGMLPSGNLFAIISFTKTHVDARTADMLRTLALSVKMALLPFDNRKTFE